MDGKMTLVKAQALWDGFCKHPFRKPPILVQLEIGYDHKVAYTLETNMHPENIARIFNKAGGWDVSVRRLKGIDDCLRVVVSRYVPPSKPADLDDLAAAIGAYRN